MLTSHNHNCTLYQVTIRHKVSSWFVKVEGACRGIMHMLGSMTTEYAELLTKLAVEQEPLQLGQELHVGQPLTLLHKQSQSNTACCLHGPGIC